MITISRRQAEILRHALGLDRSTKAYRNAYVASVNTQNMADCVVLRELGLIEEVSATQYATTFRVTEAGKKAVQA